MTGGVRVIGVAADAASGGDPTAPVQAALVAAGVPVEGRVLVDDDEAALERALGPEAPLSVVVAGPGGSAGDTVRRVLARLCGARLVLNERMLAALEASYRRHDRPLPRRAERLALLPQGATPWPGDEGEPAWAVDTPRGAFAVVPRGTPSAALSAQLIDFARSLVGARGVVTRTLRTAGVSLGDVEDRLAEWLGREGDVAVSTVPADGEVWVRLRARGITVEAAAAALDAVESHVTAALGDDCYGRDGETLEHVVGHRLRARGLTVATAESCTGGLVGHRLTNVAGSSAWFERGVVVYSNRAKQELLGVPEDVLKAHGAVSAPCAEAMARGICAAAQTPCGVAVTGIAGPDGGTPQKPVGTVFIGVAVAGEVTARHFRFSGDRAAVKWQSAQMALDMLRRRLGGS
ncbi:MAG TPA: nicotinamide-nucleotide amidohydrolase family protein [Patescibacteria group bacterium]|nr:nicotinamide-nucleotide amidohydrolase family protein [Patescibacteria group bacterium]